MGNGLVTDAYQREQEARGAAIEGNLPQLKKLADSGIPMNSGDKNGFTPLYWAAWGGQVATIDWLLRAVQVDPHATDVRGNTAIHCASAQGHADAIQRLWEGGVDACALNSIGRTALHGAAVQGQLSAATMLIETCLVKVNAQDTNGFSPLHLAAMNGRLPVVKYLVEKAGANVLLKSERGARPLAVAQETCKEYLALATSLAPMRAAALRAAAEGKMDALQTAVRALLEYRIEANDTCDELGNSPLHLAAQAEHTELIKWLLDSAHADVNLPNHAGDSALHACARKGLVHVVRFLVDLGANIEATNKGGNTPLHVACLAKQEEMVHWLAQEAHANVEARNADGDTPLLQAVAGGAHGLVSWLVDKTGAEVVVANNAGGTPLHIAASGGMDVIASWLVEYCDVDANAVDKNGDTPLHCAAKHGHADLALYLTNVASADATMRNAQGKTPFQVSVGIARGALRPPRPPSPARERAKVYASQRSTSLSPTNALSRPVSAASSATTAEAVSATTVPLPAGGLVVSSAVSSPPSAAAPASAEGAPLVNGGGGSTSMARDPDPPPPLPDLDAWLSEHGFGVFRPALAACSLSDVRALTVEDLVQLLGACQAGLEVKARAMYRGLNASSALPGKGGGAKDGGSNDEEGEGAPTTDSMNEEDTPNADSTNQGPDSDVATPANANEDAGEGGNKHERAAETKAKEEAVGTGEPGVLPFQPDPAVPRSRLAVTPTPTPADLSRRKSAAW